MPSVATALPSRFSQGAFDSLPDEFGLGVVVEPPVHNRASAGDGEFDEYDLYNESNSFADVNLDAIAELGPVDGASMPRRAAERTSQHITRNNNPIAPPAEQPPAPSLQSASVLSTQYTFDEIDDAYLREVEIGRAHV